MTQNGLVLILLSSQDSLTANLLRLIQKMAPKPVKKKKKKKKERDESPGEDKELKKHLFPGLALPNDPKVRV